MIPKKLLFILNWLTINFFIVSFVSTAFPTFTTLCVLLISSVISWFVSDFIYNMTNTERINTSNKVVLITGCDSGFGHSLAIECDKLGFHVFAGVLFPDREGAQSLREVCSDRIRIIKMDVTLYEDVVNVIQEIKRSGLELWSVVNNAGLGLYAPIEWGEDIKQLTDILNVNLLGVVRVAKLCLPLLRQSKGRVVNVCSILGRMSVGGIVHYCISKHGVRSFSEGLRQEVDQFSIKVITIEPALYRTSICQYSPLKKNLDSIWEKTSKEVQSAYSQEFRDSFEKNLKNQSKLQRKPSEVVNAMINAVVLKEPNNNYKCGGILEFCIVFPISYLPERVQNVFWKFIYNYVLK